MQFSEWFCDSWSEAFLASARILGNDPGGGRSEVLQMQCDDLAGKQISELFPACAVTRAMARARSSPTYSPEQDEFQASRI